MLRCKSACSCAQSPGYRSCELQVKALLAGALAVAVCVIAANKGIHDGLSSLLTKQERVEGDALARWLENVEVSSAGCRVTVSNPGCHVNESSALCHVTVSTVICPALPGSQPAGISGMYCGFVAAVIVVM